ncbi:MAG: hypothetical protein AABY07_03570, partial [Nanoarchaeota archaeon]
MTVKDASEYLTSQGYEFEGTDVIPHAFFIVEKNKVVFLEGRFTQKTPFHEFSHPFVKAIIKTNPKLFENLKAKVKSETIEDVKSRYSKLKSYVLNGELTEIGWEEAIVNSIDLLASNKLDKLKDKGLIAALRNLFKAIERYLRFIFKPVIKPINLNENTTLEQLAEILHLKSRIELKPDIEKPSDIRLELQRKLQSDELTGFTETEASELTLSVAGIVIDEVKFDPETSPDTIFSRVYSYLYDYRYETLEIDKNKYAPDTAAYKDDVRWQNNIDKILGESEESPIWNKLKERVTRYVNSVSEFIFTEEDIEDNRGKLHDRDRFYLNPKDTPGRRLRAWLANLNDMEFVYKEIAGKREKFHVSRNSLIGQPVKLSYDTVYNSLLIEFADKKMDDFIPTLLKNKHNPNYQNIATELNILEEGNLDDKATFKEFHSNLSKQHIKYITVLYNFSDENETMVIDSNRANAYDVVMRKWYETFKRKKIVKRDFNGNLYIDTKLAKKLKNELDEKLSDPKIRKAIELRLKSKVEVLKKIGIDIKDEVVDFMIDQESLTLLPVDFVNSFETAFHLIMRKLSGDESSKKIPLENNNPFISEVNNFRTLIDVHLKIDLTILAESFLDEELKLRYSFSEKTDLSNKVESFKDINFVKTMIESDVYYKYSHLLEQLTDKKFNKDFEVFSLSALNEQNQRGQGRAFNKLGIFDKDFLAITAFTNAGFPGGKNSYIMFPVMGDRRTPYFAKVPRIKPTVNQETKRFDAYTIDLVYKIFQSEVESIKRTQEQIDTMKPEDLLPVVHIDKNGLKYHLLPDFNKFKLNINGNLIKPESNKIDYRNYEEQIKDEINRILLENTNNTIKTLNTQGIGVEHLAQNYLDTLRIGTKKVENPKNQLILFAREFSVNMLIWQSNLYQAFWGNMNQYKSHTEATRRGAMIGSPGAQPMIAGNFKATFMRDAYSDIKNYDNLHEGLKTAFESWKFKDPAGKAKRIVDSYFDINTTDSQAISSFKGYRTTLDALGRRTQKIEDVLKKMENKQALTEKELNLILPLKLVFSGDVYDSELESYVKKNLKFSVMPPMLGYNEELDQVQQDMTDNNVDFLFFESAVKTGVKNLQDFYNKDQTTVSAINPEFIQNLPWANMREQQITPNKDSSERISSEQMLNLLFQDTKEIESITEVSGKDYTISELRSQFGRLRSANTNESLRDFISQFGIRYVDDRIEITDFRKLNEFLRQESRGKLSDNNIRSLELEKIDENNPDEKDNLRFVIPLHFIPNSIRFESILNSLIKNRLIRQRIFQDSFVATSDVGGRLIELSKIPDKITIEWLSEAKDKLQWYRIEGGKTLPAEVILPYKNRKLFTKDGTLKGEIDPENTTFIGHRDPFQGFNSLYPLKVVGFFPEGVSGLMAVPYEFIKQTGHDFDFDKIPSYFYKGEKDDKGEYKKVDYIIGEDSISKEKRYRRYENAKLKTKKAKQLLKKFGVNQKLVKSEELIGKFLSHEDISLDLQNALWDLFGREKPLEASILRALEEDDIMLSEDDFFKLPIEEQNTKDARNNALIDIISSLAGKIEMLGKLMSPNTQQPVKDINNFIGKRLEDAGFEKKEDLIPATLEFLNRATESHAESNIGISIFSLGAVNHSMAQNTDLKIPDKDSLGFPVSDGAQFADSKGNLYTEEGRGAHLLNKIYTFEGELISDVLQYLQTASLDNLQHLQLAESGLNSRTIPVAELLARLGFGISKDDGVIIPFI